MVIRNRETGHFPQTILFEEIKVIFWIKNPGDKICDPIIFSSDLLHYRSKLELDDQEEELSQELGHLRILGLLVKANLNHCSIVAKDLNSLS